MSLVVIPVKEIADGAAAPSSAVEPDRHESVCFDVNALTGGKWPVPLRLAFMTGVSLTVWAGVFLGVGWALG